jgi:hypothetical protein
MSRRGSKRRKLTLEDKKIISRLHKANYDVLSISVRTGISTGIISKFLEKGR